MCQRSSFLRETTSVAKSKLTNQCIRHEQDALILPISTHCLPTWHGPTHIHGRLACHVVSLSATQSPLSVASDESHCAPPALSRKHKHQTQNTDSDVAETKGKANGKDGENKKLGQKQLRSQISGSVSAGALRSWGSQAGSRGGSLFCSQTTNTPPLAGFSLFFLSFASPQFEDADQD